MPHDSKGNVIQAGDRVTFTAIARQVYTSETACNAEFAFVDVAATGEYAPVVTCNTRLCEKIESAPQSEPVA